MKNLPIVVDCARDLGELPHFWRSTGFTPAHRLLFNDYRQFCAYLGSVPHDGIHFVRIHYLLDLVGVEGLGTESPRYDWSQLDAALDVLHRNGLKVIFELMGNPAPEVLGGSKEQNWGFPPDWSDGGVVQAWRRLVRDTARHCIERYGLAEVRSWLFETWNEVHASVAYATHYDACLQGLMDVDPQLRFGGPSGYDPLEMAHHCAEEPNYFTGQPGTRMDFISIHDKSGAQMQVRHMLQLWEQIKRTTPSLAGVPLHDNEADADGANNRPFGWRPLPQYAAYVCNQVNQHAVRVIGEGVPFELLSNDDGFLGVVGWWRRSHMALFTTEPEPYLPYGRNTRGNNAGFSMVKKNAHNVKILLSLLGDRRCAVEGAPSLNNSDAGVLATSREGNQVAILLCNQGYLDVFPLDPANLDEALPARSPHTDKQYTVQLSVRGLPFANAVLDHYRIDQSHTNPFPLWPKLSPPPAEKLAELRQRQELERLDQPHAVVSNDGTLELEVPLPANSVSLLLLTADPGAGPDKVVGRHVETYAGIHGPEYLVLWQPLPSRGVRTYEVAYAPTATDEFQRLDHPDLICGAYLHAGPDAPGCYRVRAVDYWGRAGEWSDVIAAG